MELKIEFDSFEEIHEAMKHLNRYHDCEKCHGKIVGISMDNLGNSCCAYCNKIVKYPRLSEKGFKIEKEKWLKKENFQEK